MKSNYLFFMIALLVIFFCEAFASYSYSQSCEVDGPNGTWKQVCSGANCDCTQNWSAVSANTTSSGTFEAVSNDVKLIETVMCVGGTMGGTSCGWPGGAEYDACCSYYFGRKSAPRCFVWETEIIGSDGGHAEHAPVKSSMPSPSGAPVGRDIDSFAAAC